MQQRINQLSDELAIPAKSIMDFLYILGSGEPIENNLLVRRLGVGKNTLNQLKEKFSDILMPKSGSTQLNPDYISEVKALFDIHYQPENAMWDFLYDTKFKSLVGKLDAYKEFHPNPNRSLDQFTAEPHTVAKRATLMDFLADITDKRIAFMGDDDFTSVAVALLGKAQKITVFEIDQRIIQAIKQIAHEEELEIEIVEYDARKLIPANFKKQFDVVFTDPPYTPDGVVLFASRSVDLLAADKNSRLYLCYGNSERAKERLLPIQKVFNDCGLMIRYAFDKFNNYQGAESIGSTSRLYIADTTPQTHPVIQGVFNENIYTIN